MKFKTVKTVGFSCVLQRKVLGFFVGLDLVWILVLTSQGSKNKIALSVPKQLSVFQLTEVTFTQQKKMRKR